MMALHKIALFDWFYGFFGRLYLDEGIMAI